MYKSILDSIIKGWVAEYKFDKNRRWRFDFCHKRLKIAVEIEGGVWLKGGGRHTRGKGFINDLEKYNSAQLQGWRVLRYTPQQLTQMADDIERITKEGR